MINASQQQISAGISMPRTKGSKKATRKFALGGVVRDGNSFSQDLADSNSPAYTPSLGNDLTRANAMGAAADRMAQDRMARSASNQSPVTASPTSTAIQKQPSQLSTLDQQIAKNVAYSGLSNTERYQLDNSGNQPYKASGAAPGSSAEASQINQQNSILSTVRDGLAEQKIAGFADGGQIKETPEQLIARISGKYGVSGKSDPAPVPAAPPVSPQQPAAQPAARGIGGAFDALKNRKSQIDKAVDGYADGGKVETADELMKRMAAKYGTTGAAQAAPAQPVSPAPQAIAAPVQQPPAKGISGAIDALKNRKARIDQAIDGYASGGKIKGPGTPTSDSIPATVTQTGEPIQVSTGERIVSADQDALLQKIAQGIGFKNLDAMLEHGTGKRVGPTIRAGKRGLALGGSSDDLIYSNKKAAENGTPPTEDVIQRIARVGIDPPAGASVSPTVSRPASAPANVSQQAIGNLQSAPAVETPAAASVNTTDRQAIASFAQRSAGLTGGTNAIANGNTMIRAVRDNPAIRDSLNGAHTSIGDGISYGTTTGANGKPQAMISGSALSKPEYTDTAGNPTNDWYKTDRFAQAQTVNNRMDALADRMKRDRLERDAYDPSITNDNVRTDARQEITNLDRRAANLGEAQGRSLENQIKQTRLASDTRLGMLQGALFHENDPERRDAIAKQIRELQGRGQDGSVTLAQQAHNAEVDAAREAVAGLSEREIQRRTAQATATGRPNDDFDPNLARAVRLASLRKVGADDYFDQRQQRQASQGTDGDSVTRFRADPAMKGHTLGRQTANGTEVFDPSGKLIGHYR